jgi:hypothetical protein
MQDLGLDNTPQKRGKALIFIGLAFGLLFGGWLILQALTRDVRTRTLALPYRTEAQIVEDHGPWSTEGKRTVTLLRGGAQSAAGLFLLDEWPLTCRFYADAMHPDSLIIIQFNPAFFADTPGAWLDAKTLQELPFESLPDSLHLLDQRPIE